MAEIYIVIMGLSALAFVGGGAGFWWKKWRNVEHNCKTCAHCSMIERGKDGKLIYTCGRIDRAGQPDSYYDWALPVYCGKWGRRKG